MWHPKYSDKFCFMCGDPLDGRKSTDSAVRALGRDLFLFDQEEDTGKQALQEVEHVRYWGDGVPEIGKDCTMEDHLPLDASVGTEEGRGMHGCLKAEIGRPRKAWRGVTFDRKEHAVVEGNHVPPSVILYELVANRLQPPAGLGIIDTNGVCAN
jgi:hypothetical protein